MPDLLENRRDESAADLIDQIERRSREVEAAGFQRETPGRWRIPVLAVAIVASSAFLAWDAGGRTETTPPFNDEAIRAGLEFTVFVTVSGIEAHRERTGSLPATLAEVGLDHPSIDYVVLEGRYRVVATAGTHRLTFMEGDDLEALETSYWALRRQGTT